jgi:hypothetical protein
VGYVLQYRTALDNAHAAGDEYAVIRRSPVWWRTLFGLSWMPVLSAELSGFWPEFEIIAYLGKDRFLCRKRRVEQAGPDGGLGRRTYRLAMWPDWKRSLLPGTPNIAPWFADEATHGWELLCHYAGAIFLFETTTACPDGSR